MASVAVDQLSKSERDELVCSYSALLLQDSELEVTADSLNKVIKASGNEVESYWPGLFAKALGGTDIAELLKNATAGGAGGAAGPAATGGAEAAAEEEKPEEKEEEEADVEMGDLFGEEDY